MGSIARMDPKPPSSCWYMPRPSPQPIGQNRVFEIERPKPSLPPLKGIIIYQFWAFGIYFHEKRQKGARRFLGTKCFSEETKVYKMTWRSCCWQADRCVIECIESQYYVNKTKTQQFQYLNKTGCWYGIFQIFKALYLKRPLDHRSKYGPNFQI